MEKMHEHEQAFDLRRLILRWLISTLAIFAAVWIVPGLEFIGPGWQLGIVAIVFGLLNALIRPLLIILTCPLMLLTLGLFGLVINATLLALASEVARAMGIEFYVNDFWAALWGGIIISLVSLLLSTLAGENRIQIQVQRGDHFKE